MTSSDDLTPIPDHAGEPNGPVGGLLDGLGVHAGPARAELVEMIATTAAVAVWTCAPDGSVLSVVTRRGAVLGGEQREWQRLEWVDTVHPADRHRVFGAWRRFVESDLTSWTARYRILGAGSASARLVEDRGVRLRAGTDIGFVGMAVDITNRSATEAEARRLAAEQEALQRVAAFVATRPEPADVAALVSSEVVGCSKPRPAGWCDSDMTARPC